MNTQEFKTQLLPFEPKMHRIALSLLHDEADAQDAVQEAFLALWQGRGELHRVLNLEAYCVSMAKRKSIDLLRKRKPYLDVEGLELPDEPPPDEEPLEKVFALMSRLTPAQQEAIRLKYLEGRDHKEIEKQLNVSPENLRQTVSRGLKKLREMLVQ